MSLQALSEINNNYHLALAVHRELSDVFWFIGMPGYALLNEYQLIDEGMTQRRIKRYITSTYHAFTPDVLPKSANITEPLLGGKNRKKLTMDESWKIIKEAFHIYQDWEESALKEYQRIAADLLANGDVSAFNFVGEEILKPVKSELVYVTDKVIELNSMNWDMSQIVAEQENYYERYSHLISEMFSNRDAIKHMHHWNSSLDPITRVIECHV